jgi:hypothetical protein
MCEPRGLTSLRASTWERGESPTETSLIDPLPYNEEFHNLIQMYWLLGRKSKLATNNKLLLYKARLKPIWTYVIQLWGTASASNIGILGRFQSNTAIRRDLQIPTVKAEIRRYSARLSAHPNDLTVIVVELPGNRSLRRHLPNDLPTRFLVWLLHM